MSRLNQFHRMLCGAACVVALSACTTAEVKPPVKVSLDQAMSQATEASRAGQKAQALKLLDQAALDYPADKTPWVQKAQIKFEGGQYGEAILDAQQVLARDPTDKVANSLVAISGMRLSTKAVADLARQNNVTGSLRNESQELAKLLRDNSGEEKLFPPVVVKKVTPPPARGRKGAATTVNPPPAAKEAADSSPFGDLK